LYRNNLATVLVDIKQYNEAYEQLAAVHPPAIANYNLGILVNRKGDKAEALARFQQAAALDPKLAQAQTMVAKLSGAATEVASAPLPTPDQARSQLQHAQTDLTQRTQAGLEQTQAQAQQALQQWKTQARMTGHELQTQGRDMARSVQAEAQARAQQMEQRASDTASRATQQVQSGVANAAATASQTSTQASAAAQAALRDAEAKLKAALQSQTGPVDTGYGSGWVPPTGDDITPIGVEPPSDPADRSTYNLSDDDDTPTLLPPATP
jgi:hypothetical protein